MGWAAAGAVVVAVLLHVHAARSATIPVLWTDELGYLANAQVLAGEGSPMDLAGRPYYIGWSFLLVPLWWLLDDPAAVYTGAVVLSALFGVGVIAATAWLAARLGLPLSRAVLVGAVISLAPSRVLFSQFALSENLLTLLVMCACVAAVGVTRRPSPTTLWGLGASGTALFLVHARTAPVLVVVVLWLLVEAWHARRSRMGLHALLAAVAASGASMAGFAIYRQVTAQMYPPSQDREASAMHRLVNADIPAVVQAATGHAWYLFACWFGLAVLGGWVVLRQARLEVVRRRLGVGLCSVVAFAGVAAVSSLWIAHVIAAGRDRLDIYAYGRYLEPYGAALAAVGLTTLLLGIHRRDLIAVLGLSGLVVVAFFALNVPRTPLGGALFWGPTSVAGLLQWNWPQVTAATGPPWTVATLAAVASLVALGLLRRRPQVFAIALAGVFAVSSLVAVEKSTGPYFAGFRESFTLRTALQQFPDEPLSYDNWRSSDPGVPRDPVSRNAYQFWTVPRTAEVFTSFEDPPPTELVISRKDWPFGEERGAAKLAEDTGLFDNALWVMPGDLQDQLARQGLVVVRPPRG